VIILSQTVVCKVGKKGAIYIPKHILKKLGVKEGDKVIIKIKDGYLILDFIPDPLSLALTAKKWAKVNVKEFERESEEEQNELYEA